MTYNVFLGEDALANVSLEKSADRTISGHVRIRSKTQGIALSLGDKITQGRLFTTIAIFDRILSSYSTEKGS